MAKSNTKSSATASAPAKEFEPTFDDAFKFYIGTAMESAQKVMTKFADDCKVNPMRTIKWYADSATTNQEIFVRLTTLVAHVNDAAKEVPPGFVEVATAAKLAVLKEFHADGVRSLLRWKTPASTSAWSNAVEVSQHDGLREYVEIVERLIRDFDKSFTRVVTAL